MNIPTWKNIRTRLRSFVKDDCSNRQKINKSLELSKNSVYQFAECGTEPAYTRAVAIHEYLQQRGY